MASWSEKPAWQCEHKGCTAHKLSESKFCAEHTRGRVRYRVALPALLVSLVLAAPAVAALSSPPPPPYWWVRCKPSVSKASLTYPALVWPRGCKVAS